MGAEVLLRESEGTRSWENNSEYKSADEKENSFACFAYYQVLYAFLISTTRFTLPYLPPLLLLGRLLLGLLLLLPLLLMIMDISSSPSQVSQRCLPKNKKKERGQAMTCSYLEYPLPTPYRLIRSRGSQICHPLLLALLPQLQEPRLPLLSHIPNEPFISGLLLLLFWSVCCCCCNCCCSKVILYMFAFHH